MESTIPVNALESAVHKVTFTKLLRCRVLIPMSHYGEFLLKQH
jgi:hypothetical protein